MLRLSPGCPSQEIGSKGNGLPTKHGTAAFGPAGGAFGRCALTFDDRRMKYVLPIFLGLYVLVMFIVSSVYHSTIMDPAQFLWGFLLFIGGPIMFLASLVIIARRLLRHEIARVTLVTAIMCLVLIPTWTLGFWVIGRSCRPLMFSLVIRSNTEIAESAMKQHPEGETFPIHGFRYPLCKMSVARAYHKDGILFLTVPSGPGPKDTILYDPKKKRDNTGNQPLGGAWWFSEYRGQ